jgi:hypothetical protein
LHDIRTLRLAIDGSNPEKHVSFPPNSFIAEVFLTAQLSMALLCETHPDDGSNYPLDGNAGKKKVFMIKSALRLK